MSVWTTTPLPPRLQAGQVVFLRAKVVNNSEHGVVVQLVDEWGRPTDETRRYVFDKQVITVAEAVKAVSGR